MPRGARNSGQRGRSITRDERARREAFVEDQLATFVPLRELYPAFRARFKTNLRTAQKYVRRVHEQWSKEGKGVDRDAKRVEIEHGADAAFRLAMARMDARAAVSALDLKAKLHGLLRVQTEVSGPNGGAIPLDDARGALAAALARVAAEAQSGAPGGAAGVAPG